MTNILVILVSGGYSSSGALSSVELLQTNGSYHCSLPNLPSYRYSHTQTGFTLCGGWDSAPPWISRTSCLTLTTSGSWEESYNLTIERDSHCAWASPQGIMLLGGWDTSSLTTTEILLEDGVTTSGFSLDYMTS